MISTILQTGGPPLGDLLNIFGIGILLLAGYHYVQYRETQDPNEQKEARQKVTAILLIFVFYSIVSYVYWAQADSWVVLLGRSFEIYLEEIARNIALVDEATPTSGQMTILDGIRTIGLIAYVALFGATAIVGRAPIKIMDFLFN